ncbi:MAG: hypothetical protein A2991_01680 [Candidatus Terrybacteria bacterium RIFCSPLOWO2_01_FULL_58_14]|uniref:TrbC/VIRB2 family protein n=2 Tax=Candidatus Terryibacteriota TaxID=1817920 RepID=A0A1G2PY59_9BACT|nr:MAG: hypothetical protein A2682_02195 [Candidatus Terrybacteria bacterium RIFCSPHIGHO2_01_FULL_58_15]OHA53268.1 MAG: hypothetical protein A2991_01680 [Candidatus Terrybacteria bacterium RIFCSPLOWO2_01_FULL_58_14]
MMMRFAHIVFTALLTLPMRAMAVADPGPIGPPGGGGVPAFENPIGEGGLLGVICNVRDGLFPILLSLGVIAFIVAGVLYLFAGGNERRLALAKTALIAAIIGIALAFLAFGLPSIIANLFGVEPTELPASCQ